MTDLLLESHPPPEDSNTRRETGNLSVSGGRASSATTAEMDVREKKVQFAEGDSVRTKGEIRKRRGPGKKVYRRDIGRL